MSELREPVLASPRTVALPSGQKSMSLRAIWRASKCTASQCCIIGGLIAILGGIAIMFASAYYTGQKIVKPFTATVDTSLGSILGDITDTSRQFLGVPYAVPPVGRRRFKPAQLRTSPFDKKPFPAQATGPVCMQSNTTAGGQAISENCLSLNIYTPLKPNRDDYLHGYPVMVWFHGGNFVGGSSNDLHYNGTKLVQKGNVLVVTVNYRLGVFGFFANSKLAAVTETPGWPSTGGMNGIHDQKIALTWIKEHIRDFGGDHERVTIFGTDTGGLSVCALTVAPDGDGLFQRSIMESGACLGTYAPQSMAAGTALWNDFTNKTADTVSSMTLKKDASNLVPVLRNATATKLQAVWENYYANASIQRQLPLWSLDGRFMPALPEAMFRGDDEGFRDINSDAVMIGSNTDDGTLANKTFKTKAELITFLGKTITDQDVGAIVNNYTALPITKNDSSKAYSQIHSDTCVTCPTLTLAHLIGDTGCHQQKHVGNGIPVWLYRFAGPTGWARRGSEVNEVWGTGITDDMMDLWLSFAKTVNITEATSIAADGVTWDSFTARCDRVNGSLVGKSPSFMLFGGEGRPLPAMSSVVGGANLYHDSQCESSSYWKDDKVRDAVCAIDSSAP